jgi:hypothetical protein
MFSSPNPFSDVAGISSRRNFLGQMGAMGSLGLVHAHAIAQKDDIGEIPDLMTFLRPYVIKKETLDRFLDPKAQVWAKFDPELGYLLRNSFVRDGVDGCSTLARYDELGQRKQAHFPDQPARIHTYGNSFTQGHQVSDGETWQEVLAAHFCEPIRNFGVGGFGVYQAYKRLLRQETRSPGANHIILNIWGDDHLRSIYSWRWLSFPPSVVESMSGIMFHANPWVHARLDGNGKLIEKPSLCPSEKELYKLCDPGFLEASFREDEIVQMIFAERTGKILDRNLADRAIASSAIENPDLSSPEAIKKTANRVIHGYAIQVGIQTVEKLDQFCKANKKKLLVLLSYPVGSVWHACNRTKPGDPDNVDWHPSVFKEFVRNRNIPLIDSLPGHVAEFDTFKLTAKAYVDRYYMGHYNPKGNHFFAFAIKDELLRWLDPKPPAYRTDKEPLIRFKGYLPG